VINVQSKGKGILTPRWGSLSLECRLKDESRFTSSSSLAILGFGVVRKGSMLIDGIQGVVRTVEPVRSRRGVSNSKCRGFE